MNMEKVLASTLWILFTGMIALCSATTDPNAHLDLFHLADANNDAKLDMTECANVWSTFDVDKDDVISKTEFIMRWTFANFPDADHTPLFMRLVDNDFSGSISRQEVSNLCTFFDDDEDGLISQFEFDFTWRGLFRSSQDQTTK